MKEIHDYESAMMGLQSIAGLSDDAVAKEIAREVIEVIVIMNEILEDHGLVGSNAEKYWKSILSPTEEIER